MCSLCDKMGPVAVMCSLCDKMGPVAGSCVHSVHSTIGISRGHRRQCALSLSLQAMAGEGRGRRPGVLRPGSRVMPSCIPQRSC